MKPISELLQLAWSIAAAEAAEAGHAHIEMEHMLIGITITGKVLPLSSEEMRFDASQMFMADQEWQQLRKAFSKSLLAPEPLRRELRKELGEGAKKGQTGKISRSPKCKSIFELADATAAFKPAATALDFMRAALLNSSPALESALQRMGLQPKQVEQVLSETDALPAPPYDLAGMKTLGNYGVDLTRLAALGRLHETAGHGQELARLAMAFEHKGAKPPLLLGRGGAGKNTIAKGLAVKMASDRVPEQLRGKALVELELERLKKTAPSGAKTAELLKTILKEAEKNAATVLYLRNAHEFLAEDSLCGGELARALASRKILFMADASETEFRKLLKDSPSLEKTFDLVTVGELSKSDTSELLRQWQQRLETIHGVRASGEAIQACLDLPFSLNLNEPLPAACINLLARACARAAQKKQNLGGPTEQEQLLSATAEKHGLEHSAEVSEALVISLAAEKSGISLELVARHAASSVPSEIFELEHSLNKSVAGQQEAVAAVSAKVRKALGLEHSSQPRTKPLALLFLGPAGVGKTATALELGKIISAGKDDTAVFDLAATGGDKILDMGGPLRRMLSANPFRTVLFAHAESADQSFYAALAVFLSDRHMTTEDAQTVDIGGTVFILSTSHFSGVQNPSPATFAKTDKQLLEKVRGFFPLALLEQLDDAVIFRHLDETACTRLLLSWIDGLRLKVKEAGSQLHVGRDVERFLLAKAFIKECGAKKLRLLFEEKFSATLTKLLQKGEIARHQEWRAIIADNHISFVPKVYESQQDAPAPS